MNKARLYSNKRMSQGRFDASEFIVLRNAGFTGLGPCIVKFILFGSPDLMFCTPPMQPSRSNIPNFLFSLGPKLHPVQAQLRSTRGLFRVQRGRAGDKPPTNM